MEIDKTPTHTSVAKYKKWFEWTLVLLLVAIVIVLIQIYLVSQSAGLQESSITDVPVATPTADGQGTIAEQVASRHSESEEVGEPEDFFVEPVLVAPDYAVEEEQIESMDQAMDETESALLLDQINNRPAENPADLE